MEILISPTNNDSLLTPAKRIPLRCALSRNLNINNKSLANLLWCGRHFNDHKNTIPDSCQRELVFAQSPKKMKLFLRYPRRGAVTTDRRTRENSAASTSCDNASASITRTPGNSR